jgi:hypothetical protein
MFILLELNFLSAVHSMQYVLDVCQKFPVILHEGSVICVWFLIVVASALALIMM